MNNIENGEWGIHELSELTTKIIDGTHFTPIYITEGVPFLRVTDIHSTYIDLEKVKYISSEEHYELIKRSKPEVGDLLLSKNGTIGKVKIIDWEWEFSIFVSLALIKPKRDLINAKYLKHVLSSDFVWQQIRLRAKQGAVTNLHLEEIREFKIPLPPMKQQKSITKVLDTLDGFIIKTQQIIDKFNLVKKGMMHDLFTRGMTVHDTSEIDSIFNCSGQLRVSIEESPELYKKIDDDWLPLEWRSVKLEEILTCLIDYRGKTPTKTSSGIPLITAKNVKFGYIDREPREFIAFDSYDDWMTRGIPDKGDILFTTEAPLGNVAQIDTEERIAFAQRVIILKTNKSCNSKFLKYLLMSDQFRKKIFSSGSGSTVEGIKQSAFKKIRVFLPSSIKEQTKIVTMLDAISENIYSEENTLNKYKNIKTGLMQDLLTGKVKVAN